MIGMLKRHEIQVLRRAGHAQEEVARLAGVSDREVRRVEKEPPVDHVDDALERERRGIGRPSKAEAYRDFVMRLLGEEPGLLSVELFRRARLEGYAGAKSAFYTLVRSARPKEVPRPMVRFEGVAGEFSQHDFGQVDVSFLDGTKRRVHFFASRLKYSRWAEVTLVPNERAESLVRALLDHFVGFGGMPLVAVFDRPKTVALSWRRNGEVTEWNPTFAGAVLDLGLGVEVCWPYSPQQKGSVENLVGWVKGSFFKQRRFLDEEDMVRQLAEWHEDVNTRRPSRATGEVPAARMVEERARLRPLKVRPEELALRFPVLVGPTGVVRHDDHPYSMPPEAIGIAGTLYLYRDKVRIVAGRHEALHPRLCEPGAKSILPEHRAQAVAAVSGKRAKRYLKREHLLQLGGAAYEYITEIVHRRPGAWLHDVDLLHELLQHHGEHALREALQRALDGEVYGAEYVGHFIEAYPPTHVAAAAQQELPI